MIFNFDAHLQFPFLKTPFVIGFVAGILACVPRLLHYFTEILGSIAFRQVDIIELGIVFLAVPIGVFVSKLNNEGDIFLFQDAFKSGIKVVGIAAVIVAVFTYIYFKFIDYEIVAEVIRQNVEFMESSQATEKEIKEAEEGIRQFFSPFIQATSTLMFSMIGGGVFSLISAVVFGRFAR